MCACRSSPGLRLPTVSDCQTSIFIVMEFCSGGDLLEKLLREKKAMNEKRVALEVALPCLAILAKLHELRIIHR